MYQSTYMRVEGKNNNIKETAMKVIFKLKIQLP